jgi:hypothetical protein
VKNQIGATIVERILRAARAGQKYKIIVVITGRSDKELVFDVDEMLTVSDDGAIRVGN